MQKNEIDPACRKRTSTLSIRAAINLELKSTKPRTGPIWAGPQLLALLLVGFILTCSQISLSSQALAENEMLFGEIPSVHTVSKRDQRVTEAPSSVTLITSDEIQKFGYRTFPRKGVS